MSTKIVEVIKDLQHYVDNYGKYVEVSFVMVAPETICEDDTMDIPIDYEGEIGTSLLDRAKGDKEYPPTVEIGFNYNDKKDWSSGWKKEIRNPSFSYVRQFLNKEDK